MAYNPTLQTLRIIVNTLLMIFITGVIIFEMALSAFTISAG